ncbi:MAG: inositol monophosphatase family protein [Burkholderiaceae bacterium]
MHPMLNTAVTAARRAGAIINRASLDLEKVQVSRKQRNDFVTEVDRDAEAAIVETLLKAYPNHSILGEESGHTSRASGETLTSAENIWIIDPLDGTTNFIHGFPQYAVSIALMQKGVITQGVVYDPNRDELFTASRGRGAFLNSRRIRVSRRTRVDESLIGTGFPYKKIDTLDVYLKMLAAVTEKAAGVRRPGAAALDLCYVACGRYDGFFENGLAPWDIAAGALMVLEAGGLIGDLAGEQGFFDNEQVVAGNPKVFAGLLSLLATARRS